ncbi:hypothetical protein EXIGLDRAFT_772943 [Exidia glandulosa HHB12029]|uniref:Uncharacterized protein n=1 Tax=Exidia glandulosa HHB12029 TaxID=1314781 RepID=A0A165F175_EXIGL|nr:hypothetical protein EXIGLDRAFT_772943 [Exidia glandulosa HHB12029]
MADSDQNTSTFTRALAEAGARQQQQFQANRPFGTGKRNASFLEEDDDIFPLTIHLTSTGVSQLRPIAPYPARGHYGSGSAVFRHATPNDFLALPLPTVDLTQYPFTWTIPGAPTMPMPPSSCRATTNFRSRSPPTTPYVKRQRFNTPPPFNVMRSLSPYPSPLFTPQPASISPQAGSADSTTPSSRRVTRSGRSFAHPWHGDTPSPSASVPRASVQTHSYSPSPLALPITLPALPAGLPTPTPGLPDVLSEPHACVLQ